MLKRVCDFYHQKVAGSFVRGSFRFLFELAGGRIKSQKVFVTEHVVLDRICEGWCGLALSDRLQVCFLWVL